MAVERHTDEKAEVVRRRHVSNATVVHAPVARLRYATIMDQILELAEPPSRDQGSDSDPEEEMLCAISWYDYLPDRGAARVRVSGAWHVERNYTGEVADALGRPNQ